MITCQAEWVFFWGFFCFSVLSSKNCALFAQITSSLSCPHACINSLFSFTWFFFSPFFPNLSHKKTFLYAVGLFSGTHSLMSARTAGLVRGSYCTTLISFVQVDTSDCDVPLDILHRFPLSFSSFPFYSVPLDPSPFLWAPGSHSLLCHRVSSCFKTHNPVRSWHGHVPLMPVKIIQPLHK